MIVGCQACVVCGQQLLQMTSPKLLAGVNMFIKPLNAQSDTLTCTDLVVSSADNFCKQFGPRSGSGSKLFHRQGFPQALEIMENLGNH